MNLSNKIQEKLSHATIVDKTIYLLVVLFVVAYIAFTLQNIDQPYLWNFLTNNFTLKAGQVFKISGIYTYVTYAFMHFGFFHLLMNLIVLYYIGNLFITYFNERKFIIYYLFGAIFGGVFFVLSANFWFLNNQVSLAGASASITALLVGLAVKMPYYKIHIRFIGFVELWILAIIWIAFSFISIPNGNAGGQIAHLGGAFFGWIYTYLEDKKYFPIKKNKSNLKTVYKKSDYGLTKHQKDRLHQQKVDYLLDKISKSGYNSLSKSEREFLARASKR